jgi:hypothetical protein
MYKFAYDNRDGAKKLWRIGIKNNFASVESCNIPTSFPSQAKITWSKVLDIGTAIDCGIVFDARWQKDEATQKWNMIIVGDPWFFWVDLSGNLYAKHWTDSSILLATGVSKMSAIRAWKNTYFYNHDQGIVVAYIKNGSVYYRNYCLQPPDLPQIWEVERQLTQLPSTATDISLIRTNDYRVGFQAVADGQTHLIVSERDWAGMSIPIERISASAAEPIVEFIKIDYFDAIHKEQITVVPEVEVELGYALTDNWFVEIHNEPITVDEIEDWGKVLIIRTEHDLHNLDTGDFEIVDSYDRTYYGSTIEQIGDRIYKLIFIDLNNFNNVDKVGTLKFKGLYTTNAVGVVYLPFEKVFNPINLVPTALPLPEVVSIWNE